MQAFTLYQFTAYNHQVALVLPETWQAPALYQQLVRNHDQFAKWLPWLNSMNSAEKEVAAIQEFLKRMLAGTAFNLVIMVDGQPAGMIDLHDLNHESGEVGYWLSKDFQHLGIMTKCVELLIQYSFQQLHLKYLLLRTHPQNLASQQVALRANFEYKNIDEKGHKLFILKNREKV